MSSWKLTLPCTRDEAEAIDFEGAELLALDPAPVLLTSETVPDDPANWQLEAYFETKPGKADVAAIRTLVPSAGKARPVIEQLPDEDWVTLSQAGIEPVHAGRFYVHTSGNRGDVPAGVKTLQIEAGRAFGTGTHETTSGCLLTLDAMRARGEVARNLIDVGTGTGLLAFAALHLWPNAYATASDIDPVAVEVTAENAAINGVALGGGPGQLALAAAAGLEHELLIARAPYDLIIANVLAGPLIDLAPSISEALAPGGTLIVAGLLNTQAERVANAYRRHGLRLAGRVAQGDWPTLRLRKRVRYGWGRTTRPGPDGSGLAPGFGSW
ncbi:50S ribosomal protein L11 methyltransferase [Sphingomonas turrisvirgatae]|uniref:Ribosomal protein L11 methyltransferase n=1 Tax=Sphingomonas turrisvirgatae TaxID=1888892 RepID=A0A1E3LW16_9SPHN|nr:50S ribosomal protein L11 methyltransferase [Sphingomonas turrisvirgatae]ODP37926.1 ribonucleotide-diphosphate reductase subunit beta [Sphingomonas turrisvirgatae]